MWLFTNVGFYSLVQDKDDSDILVVRTRDRESARTALDALETEFGWVTALVENAGTDYPYRFHVSREVAALWAASEVRNYITYTNYKSALSTARGPQWESAAMRVWADMHAVTDPEKQDQGYYGYVNRDR